MKTVNIKGKEYVEVNERVKYFRENFKGWSLESELLSNEDGVCVFKATIKDENGTIKATGHAYERESSSFINKTSYIENCETSAWGRALGNLGIGIDTSIASGDEVVNAINNQNEEPKKYSFDFKEFRTKIKNATTETELTKLYVECPDKSRQYFVEDFKKRKAEING